MAKPEFKFNTTTLAFPELLSGYQAPPRYTKTLNVSDGSVLEVVVHNIFRQATIELVQFDDRAFFLSLHAWWAHAGQGKQYSFAFDSAKKVDTLLDGAAVSGQAVVPVTSTTGITVDSEYLLRKEDSSDREIAEVLSIVAGVSFTAKANLVYSYVAGDLCRDPDFFPRVRSIDDRLPVFENAVKTFTLVHQFREDSE
ncbi:hypothetical protein LCGC14_0427560 [marine sediment metagenome]|uniref:Uncharacterized protein n=1 Tax=marine sediment metagenome TaxID=412755 RepID=A0A0F9VB56_9ZZZZ